MPQTAGRIRFSLRAPPGLTNSLISRANSTNLLVTNPNYPSQPLFTRALAIAYAPCMLRSFCITNESQRRLSAV